MSIPLRLPFGAWWLAQMSALDDDLVHDGFEDAEIAFVERLLRPGMTVLDVGRIMVSTLYLLRSAWEEAGA